MGHVVGVLGGHKMLLRPGDRDFSVFFELLRAHRCRVEPLPQEPTAAELGRCDTLIVGAPRERFSPGLCERLRAWVEAGGALLLLSSMGGDEAVDGEDWPSNLEALLPGVSFPDRVLCTATAEGCTPSVRVDVSPVSREPCKVVYDRGGVLLLDRSRLPAGSVVTHAIEAPSGGEVAMIDEARWAEGSVVGDMLFADNAPREAEGHVLLRVKVGRGVVTAFAGVRSLCEPAMEDSENVRFADALLPLVLRRYQQEALRERRRRPQRHRLLHGYPMRPAMPVHEGGPVPSVELSQARPLLVGVLPHSYCNPKVKGCGFCTFPHEAYRAADASFMTGVVAAEVRARVEAEPSLAGREVLGVYFGGGTANLGLDEPFDGLCEALSSFDTRRAEVTLEGVPVYFTTRQARLLDVIEQRLSPRHMRVSMGLQTFDEATLRRMGREAFGDRALVSGVVRASQGRGMTVAGDLLINLPGEALSQMIDDVRAAVEMGFDQLGVYHLVLFEGLGTEWSNDRSLLSSLPDNVRACEHWCAVREELLSRGYVQTTLTNFERAGVAAGPRRFVYEPEGYAPERNDLVGFGPSAITLMCAPDLSTAVKLVNGEGASGYLPRGGAGWAPERAFVYTKRDMTVLYLTRKIASLGFSRVAYRALFGSDPFDDFAAELEAIREHRLLDVGADLCRLTPKGMFYADSAAGLLAEGRLRAIAAARGAKGRFAMRPAAPVAPMGELSSYGHMG